MRHRDAGLSLNTIKGGTRSYRIAASLAYTLINLFLLHSPFLPRQSCLCIIKRKCCTVLRHFKRLAVVYGGDRYGSVRIRANDPPLIIVAKVTVKLHGILPCIEIKRLSAFRPNRIGALFITCRGSVPRAITCLFILLEKWIRSRYRCLTISICRM